MAKSKKYVYKNVLVKKNLKMISTQKAVIKQLKTKESLSRYRKKRLEYFEQIYKETATLRKQIRIMKGPEWKETRRDIREFLNQQHSILEKQLKRYLKVSTAKKPKITPKQKHKIIKYGIKQPFIQGPKGAKIIKVDLAGFVELEKKLRINLHEKSKNKYSSEELTELIGASCIGTYEMFKQALLFKEISIDDLEEFNVIGFFTAFVGDTSAGWARRVMNDLNICDYVSRFEFYEWLKRARAEGLI